MLLGGAQWDSVSGSTHQKFGNQWCNSVLPLLDLHLDYYCIKIMNLKEFNEFKEVNICWYSTFFCMLFWKLTYLQ